MKNANKMPQYNPEKFMSKTHNLLETQLLYSAIELDIFKELNSPVTSEELAKKKGYHPQNLNLFLNSLTAINFLEKKDNKFSNLPETDYYLNPNSEMYIGDHLLYWKDMTSLDNLNELIMKGPKNLNFKDENGSDFFDFRSMGQGARNTMYLGRVQKFISTVREYFDEKDEFKVFDMGGGSGILSIEIAKNFPHASIIIFDQPLVTELTEEIIEEYGMSERVKTQSGNFISDNFNDKYDFIIASGVLDFVGDLNKMAIKLKNTLNENGLIYASTHGINEEFTAPKNYILGWLSSHLNGLDILKPDPVIKKAFLDNGFIITYTDKSKLNFIARKKKDE